MVGAALYSASSFGRRASFLTWSLHREPRLTKEPHPPTHPEHYKFGKGRFIINH